MVRPTTATSASARSTPPGARCPRASRTTSATQAQRLPLAPHHGHRPLRRAHGGADPHPRWTWTPSTASRRTGSTRRAVPTSQADDEEGRFAWLRQLLEWQKELADPHEFLDAVKLDLFPDEIFVFTPRGEVINLPRRSPRPVDFAYAIHSEVGNHCAGAKVNGKMVALRHVLVDGDTVEIFTSEQQFPRKDWLEFVASGKARNNIRHSIRAGQTQEVARARPRHPLQGASPRRSVTRQGSFVRRAGKSRRGRDPRRNGGGSVRVGELREARAVECRPALEGRGGRRRAGGEAGHRPGANSKPVQALGAWRRRLGQGVRVNGLPNTCSSASAAAAIRCPVTTSSAS